MKDRTQLIEKIFEDIHTIKHEITGEIQFAFGDAQITHSQWFVLHLVKKNKDINIKDLAKLLDITSSATTQIVNSLVKKGLLARKRNPDDRRTLKIGLSERSKKQFDSMKDKRFKTLFSLFDVLDNDELLRYCELNNKIIGEILLKLPIEKK